MKDKTIILVLILIPFFLLERFIFNNDVWVTRFMEFQVVILWLFAMYKSYKQFGLFSLYSLCLIGLFMFSIGGIFHFLVSGDDIRHLERGFGDFTFSHQTIQKSLWAYSVFICLSYLSYKAFRKSSTNKLNRHLVSNSVYFQIGKILMFTFFAFQIYKGYLYFTAFSVNRVDIFLLGNMANPVPAWVRFIAYFFELGYYFIIASIPNEKKIKKYSVIYFVALIPDIMLGNRGMFGAFLLFYLWYYYSMYEKMAIKTKTAIIAGVGMLVVFQLMEFMRNGDNMDLSSVSLTGFLVSQGVSFYILPLYIDYVNNIQYHLYPFFLYNILGGFSGYTGQSMEVLMHKCGVGHQLMYAVNSNYYLAGASFGSSSIVEIYDAGIVGFIIFSIFFSIMLLFFERKMFTSRFFCLGSLSFVASFVLSSRGSFFPSLYEFVKLYVFYQVILLTVKKIILWKSR